MFSLSAEVYSHLNNIIISDPIINGMYIHRSWIGKNRRLQKNCMLQHVTVIFVKSIPDLVKSSLFHVYC
jgi:hypothetical protein